MRRRQGRAAWAVLAGTVLAATACGADKGRGSYLAARTSVAVGADRPLLSVIERDGDIRGAVALAVVTEGIAPERGAVVAVALAALVEERLTARGVTDAVAVGGWNGWRLQALVGSAAQGAQLVDLLREAMLTPVSPQDPALPAVARRIAALSRRPLPDPTLVDVARCTGEAYGTGRDVPPSAAELESWRRLAHGRKRTAIATAGEESLADAVGTALARAPAWPPGESLSSDAWPAADERTLTYDASGELPPGGARIIVTARTSSPERAVAVSSELGNARGPLASRLAALDAPGRVQSVVATAHAEGGCVAATIDLSARDLTSNTATRIATAAALARQELSVEIDDVEAPLELGSALATRASDPREAANLAAWWSLAGRRSGAEDVRVTLHIGIAAPRDAPEPPGVTSTESGSAAAAARTAGAFGGALGAEIDRAATSWRAPLVEGRTRVERGQGEVWVLLASPCGTVAESTGDAGTSAVAAMAAALQSARDAGDAWVEPFVAGDGIGVLAHGPPRERESAQALARRLADLAARTFAADPLESERVGRARMTLLARADDAPERALGALGGALAPNHPSWIDPLGTTAALGASTDEAVAVRAAAMRSGPLRVAVLANSDAAQAEAAVRAVDRWVARQPGETRTCPPAPAVAAARAGTYAVDLPAGAPAEALLAIPLLSLDPASRAAARWIAAALDGPGGLLARALAGPIPGSEPDATLAAKWSAGVLGGPRTPAIVVRLIATNARLDGAVAQVRVLLDRLRQGALREEDRARASKAIARGALAESLDPRARVIELWRGEPVLPEPTLPALQAFAAATLHDDALVIVAARSPREPGDRLSAPRDTKATGRDAGP